MMLLDRTVKKKDKKHVSPRPINIARWGEAARKKEKKKMFKILATFTLPVTLLGRWGNNFSPIVEKMDGIGTICNGSIYCGTIGNLYPENARSIP
jgi:hypothetical protein